MKHEWRKHEKGIYLPKNKPEIVELPAYNFALVSGEGNPNLPTFSNYIEALYAISYGIKMGLKKGEQPKGYQDYTVYPLEGVWDITDEAKKRFTGTINKDDLVFDLMIRQPNFITKEVFDQAQQTAFVKKENSLINEVKFIQATEGKCVQMLHLGSYDNEPATFEIMEKFAEDQGFTRVSKIHREIYLSDARKVAPEKLKTVLRFNVK